MQISFLEWVKVKEQELQEIVSNKERIGSMSQDLTRSPEVGDFVIVQPDKFMKQLTADLSKKFSQQDDVGEMAIVTSVDDQDGLAKLQPLGRQGDGKQFNMQIKPSHFRDVTDAFNTGIGGPTGNFLIYVERNPNIETYDVTLKKWKPYSSPSADPAEMQMDAMFKKSEDDPDGTRAALEVGYRKAKEVTSQNLQRISDEIAKTGKDLTHHFKDDLEIFDTGKVEFIRRRGWGNILDQLHAHGHQIPGEPAPQDPEALEKFRQNAKAGIQEPSLIQKMQQQNTADRPTPIRMDPGQAAAIGQARQGSSPLNDLLYGRKAESLNLNRWKRFTETRVYEQYPTS